MAAHSAKRAVHAIALTASTADLVTLGRGRYIEVISDGTADLYFSTDGSTAVVAADGTYRIPASLDGAMRVVPNQLGQSPVNVSLISTGTPTYSVTLLDEA